MLPNDLAPHEREAWKDFIYDAWNERSCQWRENFEKEAGFMGWDLFKREKDGDPTITETHERIQNFPGRYAPPVLFEG
jgi:hypothetical protein